MTAEHFIRFSNKTFSFRNALAQGHLSCFDLTGLLLSALGSLLLVGHAQSQTLRPLDQFTGHA
jgi:hypothetical protein